MPTEKAFLFSEGYGIYTRGCKTKEEAYEHIVALCCSDFPEVKVDMDKIDMQRSWYCNKCSYYSCEDPECIECGKKFYSNGRVTFIYYFL